MKDTVHFIYNTICFYFWWT